MHGLQNDRGFPVSSPECQGVSFATNPSYRTCHCPFFWGGDMGVLFHNNKFTQKTRHVRQRFRINLSYASTIGSRSGYLTYCFCFSVPLTSFHYHCAKCGCAEKQSWGLCNQFHQCASSQNRMTV